MNLARANKARSTPSSTACVSVQVGIEPIRLRARKNMIWGVRYRLERPFTEGPADGTSDRVEDQTIRVPWLLYQGFVFGEPVSLLEHLIFLGRDLAEALHLRLVLNRGLSSSSFLGRLQVSALYFADIVQFVRDIILPRN